ncbi:hypothetical protein L596_017320 [Steinernema carpocapsae]|uniref:EGF-like domain-containing protein n=1 Tax=Steinernema carpocapsae TaxID=34508 RepID=A0A4U5N1B1_STECR|nr:hypothetical protein L596_017320 [Steinernema carpocapsae]
MRIPYESSHQARFFEVPQCHVIWTDETTTVISTTPEIHATSTTLNSTTPELTTTSTEETTIAEKTTPWSPTCSVIVDEATTTTDSSSTSQETSKRISVVNQLINSVTTEGSTTEGPTSTSVDSTSALSSEPSTASSTEPFSSSPGLTSTSTDFTDYGSSSVESTTSDSSSTSTESLSTEYSSSTAENTSLPDISTTTHDDNTSPISSIDTSTRDSATTDPEKSTKAGTTKPEVATTGTASSQSPSAYDTLDMTSTASTSEETTQRPTSGKMDSATSSALLTPSTSPTEPSTRGMPKAESAKETKYTTKEKTKRPPTSTAEATNETTQNKVTIRQATEALADLPSVDPEEPEASTTNVEQPSPTPATIKEPSTSEELRMTREGTTQKDRTNTSQEDLTTTPDARNGNFYCTYGIHANIEADHSTCSYVFKQSRRSPDRSFNSDTFRIFDLEPRDPHRSPDPKRTRPPTLRFCFAPRESTSTVFTTPAPPTTDLSTISERIPATSPASTDSTTTTEDNRRKCFLPPTPTESTTAGPISPSPNTPEENLPRVTQSLNGNETESSGWEEDTTTPQTTETTTEDEEMLTVSETKCATACEDGWTEGETGCFRAMNLSEPTPYLNLSGNCSQMGQAFPSIFDFGRLANYELFRNLSASVVPKREFVFMEHLQDGMYRLNRTVQAVNVTRFIFAGIQFLNTTETKVEPVAMAICKTPKFCKQPRCNLTEYLLAPSALNLYRSKDGEDLFVIGQQLFITCNVTDKRIQITCHQRGFFNPHPDILNCQISEEEQENERKREEVKTKYEGYFKNETIRNCDKCHKDGTQRCVNNGDDTFSCGCMKGWIGTYCDKSPDFCASGNKCQNGGECVNYVTHFYCNCKGNFKRLDCSLNVERIDYKNPVIKRTFAPVTIILAALTVLFFALALFNTFVGKSHPQHHTQTLKLWSLFIACALSAVYRHPDITDMDRYLACRWFNWLITLAWEFGLVCWCFESHLCWGAMKNDWFNKWGSNGKWHLFDHNRGPAIFAIIFVFSTLSNCLFWDQVRHSWSCMGTLHSDGVPHLIFNFGFTFCIVLATIGYSSMANHFKRNNWCNNTRKYRTSVDDPFEYGRHMEVCEKNTEFTMVGVICHYCTWILAVFANDLYDPMATDLFIVTAVIYFVWILLQLLQTNNVVLEHFKMFAIKRLPYSWAPKTNYATLFSCDETIAREQPARWKKMQASKTKQDADKNEVKRKNARIKNKKLLMFWDEDREEEAEAAANGEKIEKYWWEKDDLGSSEVSTIFWHS